MYVKGTIFWSKTDLLPGLICHLFCKLTLIGWFLVLQNSVAKFLKLILIGVPQQTTLDSLILITHIINVAYC